MQNAASLPEDINALRQLVIEQRALLAAKEAQLTAKDEQLLSRDVLIEKLKIELLRLKRMRFGRSSEQLDAKIAQLELTLEALEAKQSLPPLGAGSRVRGFLRKCLVIRVTDPRPRPYAAHISDTQRQGNATTSASSRARCVLSRHVAR